MLGKSAYLNKNYAKAIDNFSKILRKNPRTGLIFKLKLMQGICYREQPSKDLKSAEQAFYSIIQYGEERVGSRTFYKAQLELAKTKVEKKTAAAANTAANLLDILAFGIDPEKSEMFDLYEEVLYAAAYDFALAGDAKKAQEKVTIYLELFPKGKYSKRIKQLPKALAKKSIKRVINQ
jgi:TolA-binding protein